MDARSLDGKTPVADEDVLSGEQLELARRLNYDAPHGARVWNYILGGKDNFAADRRAAEQILAFLPEFAEIAKASRATLVRILTYLARDERVTQFLDIGTGLPTASNTHEVTQGWDPTSRIVYVDNDPIVLVHARALLTSAAEGKTAYIEADVRDVEGILGQARNTLDFTRPIGLVLFGILGNIEDTQEAKDIVDRLVAALPSGSFVAINDGTASTPQQEEAGVVARQAGHMYWPRPPAEIEAFFDGLDLIEPGVVSTPLWRPTEAHPKPLPVHCGVARKP
jgi:hypothetical protein